MCRKGDVFAMNREPEDAIDYEYQLKYGADYREHLHEINSLGAIAYNRLRRLREHEND